MSNQSEKYIKTSLYGGVRGRSYKTNAPSQYADQQKQYVEGMTRRFIEERAYLSSDYVKAEVQGITENFFEYVTTKIRLSDVANPSATLANKTDDFKQILFADPKIVHISVGAKIKTMGNVWLVVGVSDMASAQTTAVIARCNTSYNSYNEYGALVTEPIHVEKASMLGNDNVTKQNLVLLDGYYNIICQLNENTKKLGHNQRIMLGSMPYYITGFTDFIQEFSGDRDSVHMLSFTARLEEVTKNDDDEEDYVADGNVEEYSARINGGTHTLTVGGKIQLSASLILNDDEVLPTDENPITWVWSSSDDSVLSVDQTGLVTALSAGTAVIAVALEQNMAIEAQMSINATLETNEPYVQFLGFSDLSISQYDSEIYTAAYFENGEQTTREIQWTFSGASDIDYTADVDGNSVMITCDSASDVPLIITASCNGYTESISVSLEGY